MTARVSLEGVAPAAVAAHRDELEALEAAGWRFRVGSNGSGYVAERGGTRCYSRSLRGLLVHVRSKYRREGVA